MYKLEPNDVQAMLCEAAKVLTASDEDRAIMRKLIDSAAVDPDEKWDRALMATMLAKAGKMHEAEMVLSEVAAGLPRAQAALAMSKTRLAEPELLERLGLLRIAINHARMAETGATAKDAKKLLADAASELGRLGHKQEAESIAVSLKS